jgi:phenylacetate-CoA ligase
MTALDRLNHLLNQVSARNAFQRGRLGPHLPLATLAELADLPLTTRAELSIDQKANPPYGTNLTFELERYSRVHQVDGFDGSPLWILSDEVDWQSWARGFQRVLQAAGVGRADRVALAGASGHTMQAAAWHAGALAVGATIIPLGGMDDERQLRALAETRATVLIDDARNAIRLAETAVATGREPSIATVTTVVCSEHSASSPSGRSDEIAAAWSAECVELAFVPEAGAFGHPCRDAGGLHLDQDEFIWEFLALDADEPAAQNDLAELVVTPLGRVGWPVIRYRTGSVVEVPRDRCPAGHAGHWLPRGILGHIDDMVSVRGTSVFPSAVEQVLRQSGGVGQFRITFYTGPHAAHEVKVEAELADPASARAIESRLLDRVGLHGRVVPVQGGILPANDTRVRRVAV